MNRSSRTIAKLVALSALGAVCVTAPASLADGGAKTRIEITKLNALGIKGTIESSRSSCETGRHVQVFVYDGFLSKKVARFDAKPNGDWRLRKSLEAGRYFAKVDSKPGCRYDVSNAKRLR